VLSEFRARLAVDDQTERLLQQMLARLRERGLLVRGGRQRTDATPVLAAVRELNRLELVTETLRAALEALAAAAPTWLQGFMPDQWYDRYGQRARDWRLPKAEAARAALAVTVGADGFALVQAVHAADAPTWLRQVPAVQTLRAVWVQQYHRDQQGLRWRGKSELPPGAGDRQPRRHPGPLRHQTRGGLARLQGRLHRDLRARPAPPDRARGHHHHRHRRGWTPSPPDSGWQALDEAGFDLTRFQIDWDRQQVICPNGHTSRNWRQTSSRHGLPIVQATFRAPDCTPCPDRVRCTRSPVLARHVTFRPRTQYQTQQQLRAEQATRRSDLHQARYRGLAKTHLQHVLTALALNLVRLDAWLTGIPPGGSWASRLTRLRAAPAPT
jgi:hypothetical protein